MLNLNLYLDQIEKVILNIGKARKMLGYDPQYNFERGLNEAIAWYKENL